VDAVDECLDEETALAYVDRVLSPERRSAIERHVERCGACGQLLDVLAPLQHFDEAVHPQAEPGPAVPTGERYTVLAEHARGGQARILLAFDQKVGREVALKELLAGAENPAEVSSWRDAMARFLREAQLTGQLVHPGVVPVFDIGHRPDGTLFYTMQMVRGRTLSAALRDRPRLQDRLGLLNHFLSICHVVAYAHNRGVVHRDIKPQNIMVGEFGETVLLDWGLAKRLDDVDAERDERSPSKRVTSAEPAEPDATRDGTVLGTPGYMSPEQASGQLAEVDERSDIYGLGAVLFEILTGKPPAQASESGSAVLWAPSIQREAPPELVAVAEKALALQKRDRYLQALDLAKDVAAFMTGGRVAAYSYTGWDLTRRFAVRHRWLLSAIAGVFLAISTALILTSAAWRSELSGRRAAAAREREALQEGAKLALSQGDALQARAKLRGALELGDSLVARALWSRLRDDPERFFAGFDSAADAVSFSPDGRELAVGLQNATLQLVDVVTRTTRTIRGSEDNVTTVAYSSDGRLLASGNMSGRIALWDLRRGTLAHLGGKGPSIKSLAFGENGALLRAADAAGRVLLWDTRTGAVRSILQTPAETTRAVAFGPDGPHMAVSAPGDRVILWNLETKGTGQALSAPVSTLVYNPEGTLLAGGGLDGAVYLWETNGGRLTRMLHGHQQRINAIATSPDGRLLASSSMDGTVRVWQLPEGNAIRTLSNGKDSSRCLAFSADSNLLAAAGDKGAWVWDLSTPEAPASPPPPSRALNIAHFSPDGTRIASVGFDGALRLWDARSGELRSSWEARETWSMDVCFSPNGKLLASVGFDGVLIVHDAQTGVVRQRSMYGDRSTAVACSPDGRHVASGGYDAAVRIWDLTSGELVRTLASRTPVKGGNPAGPMPRPAFHTIEALLYLQDGRRLAVGRQNGQIEIWDIASGRLTRVLSGHTADVAGLALDPTGKTLASAGLDHGVRLWNLADGSSRLLGETAGRAYRLDWDLREKRLVVPTSTGEISVWSLTSGQRVSFMAHHGEVNRVELAPDGKTALSTGDDGTLRLWDTATWRPRWLTRAIVYAPAPQFLTHTGWHAINSSGQLGSVTPDSSVWRRAVEASNEAAAQPDGPICVTTDKGLEIWDMKSDARVMAEPLPSPFDVAALPGGCGVLKDGRVTLYRQGQPPAELAIGVSFQSSGDRLVVVGSEVTLFDSKGKNLGTFGSGERITAAQPTGEAMAVGFVDGGIEVRGPGGSVLVRFQDTAASAVTRLGAGPAGTLVAGFASGSFGVWSSSTGVSLKHGAVHGPVRHLVVRDHLLVAVSEVGGLGSIALSELTEDYCDLLAEVWSRVPVVWRDQATVIQQPDPAHGCGQPHKR
jgi:WD40 repeat protein